MRPRKSQSAMEYLMTYGWAILIIAVVLGALYSLGVFNAVNFMPKVPGGGCHVFRPNGPGTSWNVNIVGSCNNALPQYVAQFNGQSGYVGVPSTPSLSFGGSISITAWIYASPTQDTDYPMIMGRGTQNVGAMYLYIGTNNYLYFLTYDSSGNLHQLYKAGYLSGAWHFVAGTLNSAAGTVTVYIDGASQTFTNANDVLGTSTANIIFGNSFYAGHNNYFNGSIANVQVYNTSLTANQVAYLYSEGIGGVPISPQYLVGWWPLNGDTTDYSGNNNNGVPTNVIFNGTWTGRYNVP